tara:strand:+ start:11872 stop:15312 length:3441 start_codon:yes stop_codon:yes gene_type:complete
MSTMADRFNAEMNNIPLESDAESEPLTVSNLLDEDKFSTVAAYMEDRTGMTEEDYSREEIRDSFVNSMRGFNSGNSIDVIQEMNHLYSGEGDELTTRRATAASAYEVWDSLGGAFNRNTTTGEKLDAVGDYARSLILDPVNAVSLGFGKAGGAVATRGATTALKAVARAAGEAASSAAVARGASKEAIAQAATQAQSRVMTRGFQELGTEAAQTAGTRRVVGDILGSATLDSAAGVAADAGIQSVDRMVGRQEGYNATQGAISALGGVVGAGLQGGLLLTRGWSPTNSAGTNLQRGEEKFEEALKRVDEAEGAAAQMAESSSDEVTAQSLRGYLTPFKDLVAQGREIDTDGISRDAHYNFYEGLKGFFREANIPIDSLNSRLGQRRTGWYADVIADENFPAEWRDGIEGILKDNFQRADGTFLDLDEVMLTGAAEASDWGRRGQQMAAAKRAVNDVIPDGTPDDEVVGAAVKSMTTSKELDGPDAFKQWSGNFQNGFIRMLVTHPATTALNVVGWAYASGMQSTVDMIKGTLYGGYSVMKYAGGDAIGAAEYRRLAGSTYKAQVNKFRNLVNPQGTRDEVMDFLTHRPEAQKAMFSYLSGGVDNGDMVTKLNRIIDDAPDTRTGVTKAMDTMQVMYGVTAQDMLTKSQEFMYALDLNIRNKYSMSYNEFMQRDDIFTILKDPQKGASYQDFMEVEALAVEQALGNVFARKYGQRNSGTNLEFVADILEEARNVPVLGALIPFGQFFNNSIVFMADHTGISLALKPYTKTSKSGMELLTRAAAGWGLISVATLKEMDNLEDGLAWHEERNSDGKVVSRLYDFPLSFWKIIGRMGAHMQRDGGVPKPLFEEYLATFTLPSVTRGLGDAAGGVQQLATEIFAGEAGYADVIPAALSATVNMYSSGGTRFLDPLNTAMAFAEGEDYVAPARNIGNKNLNNALRYTDQIVDSLIGLDNIPVIGEDIDKAYSTQNYNAVNGRNIGVNPGRIAGSREVVPTSSIGRLYNDIGKPQWQIDIPRDNPEVQEIYEKHLFPLLEYHADTVLANGRWAEMSLAGKESMLGEILTQARADIKESLAATPSGPRAEASLIININNLKGSGRQAFDQMMAVFDTNEEDLGDLSLPQLQLLYDSIKDVQGVHNSREEAALDR